MRLYLYIVAFNISLAVFSQKSEKRGMAYGHHSQADMQGLESNISWWYNWYHLPDEGLRENFKDFDVAFVPMAWNGDFDEVGMRSFLSSNPQIEYLLGFNEPNFTDQANMTPSEAAVAWPKLEQIAKEFNLKIVGPAVNYCGNCVSENGIAYSDPIEYLDDFFEACQNCQVDYIAVHWYGCGGLDWYLDQFAKYNLPIWVTEIACWDQDNISLDQQKSFLINAVDQIENHPNVEKYAWFTGRGEGPFISLLGASGQLTELGELYMNMPIHDEEAYVSIPAKIEAEAYQQMDGVQLELCSEGENEINVGYLESGDFLEYNIEVAEAGVFNFNLRYAAIRQGKLGLELDDVGVLDVFLPTTGDWQDWENVGWDLELSEGTHTIRLVVLVEGFNLNWMDIQYPKEPLNVAIPKDHVDVYPNPADISFSISELDNIHQIIISNINHQVVYREVISPDIRELKVDVSGFSDGLYIIRMLSPNGGIISSKLLVQHL